MPPQAVSQASKPAELSGKLSAPVSIAHADSTAFHAASLDTPHESHTTIVLNDGVMGWSKVKKRLGRDKLEPGDPILIKSFAIAGGALVAREIA
jgi:hypothetical protein